MLRCNKYPYNPQGESMDCNSLVKRLQNCFTYKSEVEQYIDSRLATLEVILTKTMDAVARGREKLAGADERDVLSQLADDK